MLTLVFSLDNLLLSSSRSFIALRRGGDRFAIGRGSTAEQVGQRLWLADSQVSKTHAALERRIEQSVRDGRCVSQVIDSLWDDSKNGTSINGRLAPRRERVDLSDGDLIQLGRTLLCYRRAPVPVAVRLAQTDIEGVHFGLTRTFCPSVVLAADALSRAAATDKPVLLLGETGVGKEAAARSVHDLWAAQPDGSHRGRFVPVNCAAIADGLFESAFFGHMRGAFTGAIEDADGYLRQADRGTIFLDEVGSLALTHQAKLLRVIEDGLVRKVGGKQDVRVRVRYVAATNEDLSARMRPDLRFRLSGEVFRLTPLRERREDLGSLIRFTLIDRCARHETVEITPEGAQLLCRAAFPGNIRQLRDTMQSAIDRARAGDPCIRIGAEHLPADLDCPPESFAESHVPARTAAPFGREERFTRADIELALQGRSKKAAADMLDITSRHLDRLLSQMGLLEKYRKRTPPTKKV